MNTHSPNWRQRIHTGMNAVSPRLADAAQSAWQRRYARRAERRRGLSRLARRYIQRNGLTVRRGPFQGMRYRRHAVGGALIPELLGCYERELHGSLEAMRQQRGGGGLIIDIGAAEGYYAVGMARLFPTANVIAYELNPMARRACRKLAKLNGVAYRVDVQGRCEPQTLAAVLQPDTLIFCDCEGYEWRLLDPVTIPALRRCHLIVELHKTQQIPDVAEAIHDRFTPSHKVELIDQEPRNPQAYPELETFSATERKVLVNEPRGERQRWAVCTPV